jgi:predicted esterase
VSVHVIQARTHGRYLVDRPAGDQPQPLLVGFHGYAENAERMLQELTAVRGDRLWTIVSIQALNRFYSKASTVVANWMTREDRDHAIADNLAYVRSVLDDVRRQVAASDLVVYAGFSQGVAMAYRAAAFVDTPRAGAAILLAGDIPPDVVPHLRRLPPLLIGRGTTDHWYTDAKASLDGEHFEAAGVSPETYVFDGGHVWDSGFVARAGGFLDRIGAWQRRADSSAPGDLSS